MTTRFARAMRLSIPVWFLLPVVAVTLAAGFGGGYLSALRLTSPCPLDSQSCAEFANFWRAWDIAADNYVDPTAIDPQTMTDGAIEGMLDSLGDVGHTRYLSADEATSERESLSGRFEGIGAYIDVQNDQPLIVQPIEGSPAERAGLRAGDKIMQVNGEDVRGLTVEELRSRVRGPKGTPVTLTILHEGDVTPIDVSVVREEIQLRSVSWRMLPDGVALLNVNRFAERTTAEFSQALSELEAQGARAIVLDLRNNPGGLVNELVGVASQLLPPESTVMIEQDRDGQQRPYRTSRDSAPTTLPVVVLVNENSASAAEILAGAVKENARGRVVGLPTFGTATVLRPFDLPGGAQLRIGTSQWLTPEGEEVRGVGIEPDELVALPPGVTPLTPREAEALDAEALRSGDDKQLARALEVLDELARQ
jgi:carboxyl-terminal processing protease